MSAEHTQGGIADAEIARAELYDTLAQLRDRLDFAQRIDNRLDRCTARVREARDANPLGFAAGIAATAAAAGLAAWGIAQAVVKRIG